MSDTYNIGYQYGLFYTKTDVFWYKTVIYLLNIILTPIILFIYSIFIYLFPCIQMLFANISYFIIFKKYNLISKYEDVDFPPDDNSLGTDECNKLKAKGTKYKWSRCNDITIKNNFKEKQWKSESIDIKDNMLHKLFSNGITATDICQGALGDCWLLSALAALSEYPNKIQDVFLTDSFNYRGIYYVKLYHYLRKEFITISMDDFIPCRVEGKTKRCSNGIETEEVDLVSPLYTQPNGNECWVLLLEKAFAKYIGSYQGLNGGYPIFALHILTGDPVEKYALSDKWKKLDMHLSTVFQPGCIGTYASNGPNMGENLPAKSVIPMNDLENDMESTNAQHFSISDVVSFYSKSDAPVLNNEQMFEKLYAYCHKGYIIAAGSNPKVIYNKEIENKIGLVAGHAYTVLGVFEPKLTISSTPIRIVKLRNPWGQFEWKGAWGDESDLWKNYPGVKLELQASLFGGKMFIVYGRIYKP